MTKPVVLVVEDDGSLAIHLEDMLNRLGYEVAGSIACGEEAVAFVSERKVDLVLIDIELAGSMDGVTAAEKIYLASDVPVVFLAGFTSNPLLQQASVAAPYGYLIKPVLEQELAATIGMALHRHSHDCNLRANQLALKKSEARYRHIFDSSPLGIFRTTIDGRALAVNPEMARIVGCADPEEAIHDFTELAGQLYVDPRRRQEFIDQLRQTKVVNHFEYEGKRKDGRRIWISMNARLTTDDPVDGDGGEEMIDGFAIDITERKLAEQEVLLDEARLESLLRIHQHPAEGVQELLDFSLREVLSLTGSGIGSIYHYDERSEEFSLCAWSDRETRHCAPIDPHVRYPLGQSGIWGEVVRRGRPVLVNDGAAGDHPRPGLPLGHVPLRRFLLVPVFSNGRIVAVVGVADKEEPYQEADTRQLNLMIIAVWKIVERIRAEAALRASEKEYRTLVEMLPDIISRFDRRGRFLFVSENVSDFFDLKVAEIIGRTHRELGFPVEMCRQWEESVADIFLRGVPAEMEFVVDSPKGQRVFNWRLVPERESEGAIESVLGLCRDVTAHRQAERDYKTLFHEMLNGFALHEIIVDRTGTPSDYRFIAVNPAFERMTGLGAADVVGRTVLDVLPQTEKYWIDIYGRVALSGVPIFFENYAGALGKYFEVTAFRPAPRQFACIISDITARKEAEQERKKLEVELRQAQKMEAIGTLAGGIAHDFNNILGAILGYAEMAREDCQAGSLAARDIEQVILAGNRARGLVKQILAVSRQVEIEQVLLQPSVIIQEAVKLVRSSFPATIRIVEDVDPDAGLIHVDPSQIHQIVMNLCTNSYHAMEENGGVLTITLQNKKLAAADIIEYPHARPGAYVQLTVADTGPGIAPEIRERIFDPYFTTKESGKGTGLGLAIVHGIAESYGGFVICRSEPGAGSEFCVSLPIHENSAETPDAASEDPDSGKPCRERILFVDDEEMLVSMAATMLGRLGYQVTASTSSREALAIFRDQPDQFDLVITDQTMPEMTGIEFGLEILRIRPGMPIILCTGYSRLVSEEKIKAVGIRALALKPLARQELSSLIREALREEQGT